MKFEVIHAHTDICIIKIHVPRAHEVLNQRVTVKRTSKNYETWTRRNNPKWTDNIQYGKWY